MFKPNLFKAALVARGISQKELAAHLKINESTIYRKVQANGDFSREEINSIIEFLGLSAEEYKAIFFAPDLA